MMLKKDQKSAVSPSLTFYSFVYNKSFVYMWWRQHLNITSVISLFILTYKTFYNFSQVRNVVFITFYYSIASFIVWIL